MAAAAVTIAARLREYGSTPRILGVDVARGLAMLGMFGAHVGVTQEFDLFEPSTWLGIVDGRSAVLFALLAGVSIAILTGRGTVLTGVALLQARTRIFARAALIFAVGGVLQALGTNVAVILPVYALLFVLALAFLRWPPRRLFLLAAAIAILAPVAVLLYSSLTASVYVGSSVILDLFVTGVYPGIVWIAFVLVGLGVGRLDLASMQVATRVALVGLVLAGVGYGLGSAANQFAFPQADATTPGTPSAPPVEPAPDRVPGDQLDLDGATCDVYADGSSYCYPEGYFDQDPVQYEGSSLPAAPAVDWASLLSIAPHSGAPFEVIGATGFALFVLGVSLLLVARAKWIFLPIVAVGSMALTAYSLHIVVLGVIGQSAYEQPDNWLYLGFVVGALVFCTAWWLLVGRGPFERLLGWVSRHAARIVPAPTPDSIEAA